MSASSWIRGSLVLVLAASATIAQPAVLSGAVYDGSGGPLVAGTTYQSNGFSVPTGQTLTIPDGVIIKFGNAATLTVNGTLITNGTGSSPVRFTSIHDDSIGLLATGSTGTPGAGDWARIDFNGNSGASQLSFTSVRYLGANGWDAIHAGSGLTMTSCTVSDCSANVLNLENSNAAPTFTNCAFDNGQIAVVNARLAALAGFSGCTATGNTVGDYTLVTAPSTGAPSVTVTLDDTLNGAGVIASSASLTVSTGDDLTFGPGIILKFTTARILTVNGTLITQGTAAQPVYITSIADDAAGGDSNKDGSATTPAAGDWIRVDCNGNSGATNLAYTIMRYGGNANWDMLYAGADISMSNCTVSDGLANGLNCENTSFPTVVNCAFDRCARAVTNVKIDALAGFSNCTATGNSVADHPTVTSPSITNANAAVSLSNTFNGTGVVGFTSSLTIANGETLTLGEGVIFKWESVHTLTVNGVLITNGTAANPVVITSIKDDSAGGDSNLDGTATVPAPGDWIRISFNANSDASRLVHTEVRYAGAANWNGVMLNSSDVVMEDCTVSKCLEASTDLTNSSFPTLIRCDFSDSDLAVVNVPLDAFANFVDCTGQGNTQGDHFRVTTSAFGSSEIRHWNTLNDSGVVLSTAGITVSSGETLTLHQGVKIKFAGPRTLTVNGHLDVLGAGYDPVILTSALDDTVGGDSNGDGGATTPAPGNWIRMVVTATATGSIRNMVVRYAGQAGWWATEFNSPAFAVRSLRVENSAWDGARVNDLQGNLENYVALNCAGRGLHLLGGTADVVHATIAGCATGMERSAAATGRAINSIAYFNGTNFVGFPAADVLNSNGSPAAAGLNGNIDTDPLFGNLLAGDVTLAFGSPCRNAGQLAAAIPVAADFDEKPRVLDHDVSGQWLPDMGAHEAEAWTLVAGGTARVGDTVTFDTVGPVGSVIFGIGPGDGTTAFAPYGILLAGALGQVNIDTIIYPVGFQVSLNLADPGLANQHLAVQAAVFSTTPGLGNFTRCYRATVQPE